MASTAGRVTKPRGLKDATARARPREPCTLRIAREDASTISQLRWRARDLLIRSRDGAAPRHRADRCTARRSYARTARDRRALDRGSHRLPDRRALDLRDVA